MFSWFTARWQAFQASFDPDETSTFSNPIGTVGAASALAGVFLVVGLVPPLARLSQATATLPCVLLALAGGGFTYLAYRERCRGTLGELATLLDNGCYAASLSLEALHTSGGFAVGFAVVQALMVISFPASIYGFSLLMALVLCGPTLLLLSLGSPSVPVTLVLLASCIMTILMLITTSKRRDISEGAKRLQQALGATDQVLDLAMQRALTTTLLNLGNFLHELRNVQSGVRLNLQLLADEKLQPEQREAVRDALAAARSEQALLDETLEDLRRQAQPRAGSVLVVGEVLERTLRGRVSGLEIDYHDAAPSFHVQGEPSHLATVLRNLLRNARQAGATRVAVDVTLEAAGESLLINVLDDGPGIAAERLPRLFQPFVGDEKPSSTGLGLYLCRRYIELMRGEIRIESQLGEGTRFVIRLPGSTAPSEPAQLS